MLKIAFCRTLMIVAFTAVLFSACKKSGSDIGAVNHPLDLPIASADVIKANNEFAFKFLQSALQQDKTQSNKLISPLSIYLAISMVYNGADNVTKDSIQKALQLHGTSIEELNAVCKALIEQLPQEDSKVQLAIANSIWYNQNGAQPLQSFLNTVSTSYKAQLQALSFGSEQATKTINDWVKATTKNKIEKIVDATSTDDLMYLINAIYFKGAWQYKFDAANTANGSFYLHNGSIVTAPFMQQTTELNILINSDVQIAELPYGSGKAFSMYVVMPKNDGDINAFAAAFNANELAGLTAKMSVTKTQLLVPKFTYSYSIDRMQPELAALGMGVAFSSAADFTRMYSSPAQITKAIHKTFIQVNEEGTEAAAVTSITIGETSSSQAYLNLDHPFVYVIAEKQTGAVLFTGILNNPSE